MSGNLPLTCARGSHGRSVLGEYESDFYLGDNSEHRNKIGFLSEFYTKQAGAELGQAQVKLAVIVEG